MPQQINLCVSVLRSKKQPFTARTMLPALGVFFLLGASLCAAWVWNLSHSAQGYRQNLSTQASEIQSLQAAILLNQANAGPVAPAQLAKLQMLQLAVHQRAKIRDALQRGVFRPGEGHSDRLSMVAKSIPASVWVTTLGSQNGRFEVAGYTLEPEALNDWVARLQAEPLMRGLKLSMVTVEKATNLSTPAAGKGAGGFVRPVWTFTLLNQEPSVSALPNDAKGGKP